MCSPRWASWYAKLPDTAKAQAVQTAYTYASELAKYHTNSGYDADSWVLRLKAVEDELNLDPSDYFIAKALSKAEWHLPPGSRPQRGF